MRTKRLNGKQSLELRQAVWAKTDGKCCYCKTDLLPIGEEPDRPDSFTIEHEIPIAEGGSNHFYNLLPCCRQCNNDRGKDVRPIVENPSKRLRHHPFAGIAEVIDLSGLPEEPDLLP